MTPARGRLVAPLGMTTRPGGRCRLSECESRRLALVEHGDPRGAIAGGGEPRSEAAHIGDDEPVAVALDEPIRREPTEHERDRLARRTDQLAEEPPRHRGPRD